MAKLSSSNGIEKFPKLRFPEFKEPWNLVKLEDVCSYRKGRAKVKKAQYVRTENILQNYAGIEPYDDLSEAEGISIQCGDTLMANIRPYLKKVWQSNFNGACSTDVLAFSPDNIDGKFLYFLIAQDRFVNYVMCGAKGSKMPRGDKNHILEYETGVPTESEQRKIAHFIDLLNARISSQNSLINLIKKYKRGVIKTIFDTLTPVSKSSIGKMATMFSGGTPRSDIVEYYNGSIPFIRSGEIHNDFTELHLSQIGLDNSSAKMVRKGDLLYALYGATSGEVDISKIDGAINQAILCIRTNEISSEYLALWLEINKNNILSKMLQGGQGNLSGELVKSLVVPIYSKTEEQVIVRIGNSINKLIDANTNMLYMLNKAKESLLQQMFI